MPKRARWDHAELRRRHLLQPMQHDACVACGRMHTATCAYRRPQDSSSTVIKADTGCLLFHPFCLGRGVLEEPLGFCPMTCARDCHVCVCTKLTIQGSADAAFPIMMMPLRCCAGAGCTSARSGPHGGLPRTPTACVQRIIALATLAALHFCGRSTDAWCFTPCAIAQAANASVPVPL